MQIYLTRIEKEPWKVLPLQMVDLIAFEAMKDRDNELGETKRARRLSLSALMSSKCSGSRGYTVFKQERASNTCGPLSGSETGDSESETIKPRMRRTTEAPPSFSRTTNST